MEFSLTTRPTAQVLKPTSTAPWAIEIVNKFGDFAKFMAKFSVDTQRYCATNMERAVALQLPSFGRIIATYGEANIAAIIKLFIKEAIIRMGEDRDLDPYDLQFIAEGICQNDRIRILRFTTVFGFFHHLKCGEFDIYGHLTPRKVLEVMRKWAENAKQAEERLAAKYEDIHRAEEQERHRAEAIPWSEYARRHGIEEPDIITYIQNRCREANERRERIRGIGTALEGTISAFAELFAAIRSAKTPSGFQKPP